MTPIFTNEDRKEAIELLKRFNEFLKRRVPQSNAEDENIRGDIETVYNMLEVLEDWMFIK